MRAELFPMTISAWLDGLYLIKNEIKSEKKIIQYLELLDFFFLVLGLICLELFDQFFGNFGEDFDMILT
jgi:hypothetical protein